MSKEKQMVADTIEEMKNNIDLFYQQKTREALSGFDGILEKLLGVTDTLFSYRQEHEEFALDEERIKENLTEAMKALEECDMILLADILQYDFVEYIEEIMENME